MEFNARVWAKAADDLWHQGTVFKREEVGENTAITVRFEPEAEGGRAEEVVYTITREQADEGEGTQDLKLQNVKGQAGVEEGADVDDLIVLTHLHEPAILFTLHERYKADIIYTYTGPILLAINPFWRVPLYTVDILEEYRKDGKAKAYDADFQSLLPPHVYAVADNAYRLMTNPTSNNQKRNQSILVSGESGAGKTETTKIIMKYLAILGGHDEAQEALLRGDDSTVSIEHQVLQSNPILEAFGNARTVRNDNSSRFGKFIEIDFDKDGKLIGAAIRTFLLEKIRLVHQSEQERNFHIFYLMLAGCAEEERERWHLNPDPRVYNYINQSQCYHRRDGVKDSDLWGELTHAMKVMDFTPEESEDVFNCVAGVINCGNITFDDESDPEKSSEPVAKATEEGMTMAQATAKNLGVEADKLIAAMTSRTIKAGHEVYTVYLDAKQGTHLRDALCKATYSGVFDWLVNKINQTIDRQRGGTGAGASPTRAGGFSWGSPTRSPSPQPDNGNMFIGLLDIFGFESFESNFFEQFLINFANEKLQQQFNHFVFEVEQQEYEREKIKWDFIEFPDNKDSIDLIEAKPAGILALLDEQCLVPQASDQKLAGNLYKHLASHSRFKAGGNLKVDFKFMINHYAGDITYSTEGFLEKNRDLLHQEGIDLLKSSTKPFLKTLADSARAEAAASQTGARGRAGRQSGLVSSSVGAQFKNQLNNLLGAIDETHPHYIRCLKPNDKNVRSNFNVPRITNQLANGGVLAAVHVARAGFPVRMTHAECLSRYAILGMDAVAGARASAKRNNLSARESAAEEARALVMSVLLLLQGVVTEESVQKSIAVSTTAADRAGRRGSFRDMCAKSGVQLGDTKVFFRQVAFNRAEKARTVRLTGSCVKLQTCFRRHRCSVAYTVCRLGTLRLQARVRGAAARRRVLKKRLLRATLILQTLVRRGCKRRQYLREKDAAIKTQAQARSYIARRSYLWDKARAVTVQCAFRKRKAVKLIAQLRKEAADVAALQAKIKAYEEQMKAKEEEMRRQQQAAVEKALAEAEAIRLKAEQEAEERRKKQEEEDRQRALQRQAEEEERARVRAEEEAERARVRAEEEAERARLRAEEEERARVRKEEEEAARIKAEAEAVAKALAEAEAARIKAEEEAEAARIKAEEEAEAARIKAEEEVEAARIKAEEEAEAARIKAEEEAAEAARIKAEDEAAALAMAEAAAKAAADGERARTLNHHGHKSLPPNTPNGVNSISTGPNSSPGPNRLPISPYGDEDPRYFSPSSCGNDSGFLSPQPSIYSQHSRAFSFNGIEELDLDRLSVCIDKAYITQARGTTPHVGYRVRIKTTSRTWTVERRYSDFVWLNDALLEALPQKDVPAMPARRLFKDKLDAEFIEERRMQLQDYLVELLSEKGHWLVQQSDKIEVGIGFSKQAMKEMVARQSLIAFMDKKQQSLAKDEDTISSAVASGISSLFGAWK
ncbi:unnamed protein product [Chrysoparadoxa australica]